MDHSGCFIKFVLVSLEKALDRSGHPTRAKPPYITLRTYKNHINDNFRVLCGPESQVLGGTISDFTVRGLDFRKNCFKINKVLDLRNTVGANTTYVLKTTQLRQQQ